MSFIIVELVEFVIKDIMDIKEEKSYNKLGNLINVVSVGLRKYGNKRDSGISVDIFLILSI